MFLLVEDCLVFLEEDCVVFLETDCGVFLEEDCLVEGLESFLNNQQLYLIINKLLFIKILVHVL